MTDRRRVYVGGRGAVSAFGAGRERLAEGVFAGECALRPRDRTAAFEAPTSVAAEAPADCLAGARDESEWPRVLARHAGREALEEATRVDPADVGLVLASTKADLSGVVGDGDGWGLPARLARILADDLRLSGVRAAVSSACASGLVALAIAERRIARGEDEHLLVVGVDVLSEFIVAGFGGLHALDPGPCRPFDARRRGISLGDGASAVLLSARPEVSIGVALTGHGGANDAFNAVRPDADGQGLVLASTRALDRARLRAADIDLVHVHGTGTMANDASEAAGLVRLFGGRTPPAFGTKGQTGHTLGAAGLLETLLVIHALERATVPVNVGLERQGVDERLDLVREPRTLARPRRALKVAGGFGGVQAAVVLES